MDDPLKNGKNQIPLESVSILSNEQLLILHKHWIETVEQLLSAASTEEGRRGLRALLDLDEQAFVTILVQLSELLPVHIRDTICRPQRGGSLGVLFDQKDTTEREEEK